MKRSRKKQNNHKFLHVVYNFFFRDRQSSKKQRPEDSRGFNLTLKAENHKNLDILYTIRNKSLYVILCSLFEGGKTP